jgi:hypothetical protein
MTTKENKVLLTYTGPFDAVEVPLPDGSDVVVERGKQSDFPDEVAQGLLAQADNWKSAKAGKDAGQSAPADKGDTPGKDG